MAKKPLIYKEQINFLTVEGTHDKLVAISYFRGDLGKMGQAAKDMLSMGIESFLTSLSPSEKIRFNDILKSVKVSSAMKADNP